MSYRTPRIVLVVLQDTQDCVGSCLTCPNVLVLPTLLHIANALRGPAEVDPGPLRICSMA